MGGPVLLAPWRGFEPLTPRLGGACSIHLSYQGSEARNPGLIVVEPAGIEPTTSSLRTRRSPN